MNNKHITIRPSPGVIHLSPYGFNSYAADFLRAAMSFTVTERYSPVPYYLYCRAIELGFKSYLLSKRVPKVELQKKTLGHDLIASLDKCEILGLSQLVTIDHAQRRELEKANEYYKSKGFEYFFVAKAAVGYPDLPDLTVLEFIATKLVNDLRQYCIDSA